MYNLAHFVEKDEAKVREFVKAHPFAFITGCDSQLRPVATQIPVFIDEKEGRIFLSGHMMRQTDHQLAFQQNPNALVVFTGSHSYVSASWYKDQKQASTWNYMSVHARGKLQFLDEAALLEVLKRTTNHFENDPQSPSLYEHLPVEYVHRLAKAIVAFEIEVTEMVGIFKLSQNRDDTSYRQIVEELDVKDDAGANEIAAIMKTRREL
jgi:transcriptional regulator